ncbi:hypothetical protein [Pseudomonas luteola]|uniref:Transcriptional regulator n=1 Tax=Pseudomonas luteola TaxID=47886 RepID=A0ABS0FS23_PSELU|nr:hypothetical protein [Pseudomonas zeshuii]MBF8643128.1 hypothetical protein [Pseudomonas zeshuii]
MKNLFNRLFSIKRPVPQKLSATQLSRLRVDTPAEIQQKLIDCGYIKVQSGFYLFTDLGRKAGGEIRKNHPDAQEGHMVWPADIAL